MHVACTIMLQGDKIKREYIGPPNRCLSRSLTHTSTEYPGVSDLCVSNSTLLIDPSSSGPEGLSDGAGLTVNVCSKCD